jgi:hypothetical protein
MKIVFQFVMSTTFDWIRQRFEVKWSCYQFDYRKCQTFRGCPKINLQAIYQFEGISNKKEALTRHYVLGELPAD